ncbi:MAG: hypothetical protein MJY71_08245 [Bacteroidaceae bacterium]|nr:hypothetical protein [Bacteroidaceae bacterium]
MAGKADNVIGIAMDLDVTSLKAGLSEANRLISNSNAKFKSATSGMEDWKSTTDGLNAKLDNLNEVLDLQQRKLAGMKAEYDKVVKAEGENSRSAQALKKQMDNQQVAINKTRLEVEKYRSKLSDAESATGKLGKKISDQESDLKALKKAYADVVLEQGKDSKAAKDLASQIDSLSSDLSENKKKMSDASRAADELDNSLDKLGDSAKDAGDGFTIAKGAISTFIGNGLTALAGAAKNAISSIANLASETKEYREDMAKLKTGFEEGGFSAEQATKVYKDFYAVLGEEDRSVEAVNHLAKLVDTQEDLDKWTTICTGVWGTFGDSLPIEGLTEAANETAKTGELTGVLTDAINWATSDMDTWNSVLGNGSKAQQAFAKASSEGMNAEDAFKEALATCSTEQERQQLITNTLNGLYGDAADKYREVNKSVIDANKANSDYTDSMAKIGEKIEPVTTAVKNGFNDILKKILELTDGVDFDAFAEKISNGFTTFTDTYLPKIIDGFTWIKDNWAGIEAGIAAIAAAFLAFKVVTLIQAVTTAMEGMTLAQAALNLVMSLNPIGLVVAAIAALVAAFVVLWNKSEAFRNFWKGLWEGIKNATKVVIDAIGKFFSGAWDGIKKAWSAAGGFFKNLWSGIKNTFSSVKSWFSDKFKAAWNGIKSVWSAVGGFFSDVWDAIKSIFSNIKGWFSDKFSAAWNGIKNAWSSVKSFFSNIWSGIKNVFSSVGSWFSDIFKGAWNGIKNAFGSVKEFFSGILDKIKGVFKGDSLLDVGKNLIKGLWNGINDMTSWVISKIEGFGDNVLGGIKKFFHIESPSKVMRDQVGVMIAKGVGVGIESQTDSVVKSMTKLGKATLTEAKTANKNGEYTKVGADAISDYKKGLESKSKDAVSAVKSVIAKQVNTVKNQSKEVREEYKKAGEATLTAFTDAVQSGTQKAVDKVSASVTKITDAAQKSYDNLISKRDSMQDKLSEESNLFTITDGKVVLNDLKAETKEIKAFGKNLEKLKGKVSDNMLAQLGGLGAEDGLAVTNKLLSLSQKELAQYVKDYADKLAASKKVSKAFYADEIADVKSEFSSKISKAFKDLPDKIESIGESTAKGFVNGMKSKTSGLSKDVKKIADGIVSQFKKSLKIHSPSKVFAELGAFSGMGFVGGFADKVNSVKGGLASSIQTNDLRNAPNGSRGATGSKTVVNNYNQTINAPKQPSRLELYRDTKNLLAWNGGV